MKKTLSSGKLAVASTVVLILGLSGSILLEGIVASRVFLLISVAGLALLMLNMVILFRLIHSDVRAISRRLDSSEFFPAGANSLLDLPKAFRNDDEDAHPSSAGNKGVGFSIFTPGAIPANTVKAKPYAHKAGRGAAHQEMEDGGWNKLLTVTNPRFSRGRKIALLGSEELEKELITVGEVVDIRLGKDHSGIPNNCSQVVIDERATHNGQYAGFLETTRTQEFIQLLNSLAQAKRDGVVIINITDGPAHHFTRSIRDVSDINIPLVPGDTQFDTDIDHAVINAVTSYVGSRDKHAK